MVGIRVFHASQHFADHKTFQTTFNGLYFFHTTCFQADRSQRSRRFFGRQIEVDILFQPVVRDIHIIIFLLFLKKIRKVNKIFRLTEKVLKKVESYFTTEDAEDTEDSGKMINKCKSVISKCI